MRVFWEKGYAEASYDDLVERTGVSRKGLYTVFGDKRALFEASLKHYRHTVAIWVMEPLDRPDLTLEELRHYFIEFAERFSTGYGKNGCLIANTAMDETSSDPVIKIQIDKQLDGMTERFQVALTRAGIEQDRVPALAAYCTGIMQGLFVLAHAQANTKLIEDYVKTAVTAVE